MERELIHMERSEMPVYPYLLTSSKPAAAARVRGGPDHRDLRGTVWFWQSGAGVVVSAWITGLPPYGESPCDKGVFALHIHEGGSCTGTAEKPFTDAGKHYNPGGCPHPYHAGDLPPLFADGGGNAWYAVMTDRFTVEEVLGHVVVVHAGVDDFTGQPSGNAGDMIACGEIRRYE